MYQKVHKQTLHIKLFLGITLITMLICSCAFSKEPDMDTGKKPTITYILNEGTWNSGYRAPSSFELNQTVTLPTAASITRPDADFLGWYKNKDFKGTAITGWNAGDITGNVIVYAQWSIHKTLSVSEVATDLKNLLSGGAHTIKVTGSLDTHTIQNIKTALKENETAKVSLNLSELTGLGSIGEEAFSYCTNLTNVTIPSTVASIEKKAFEGCSSLTSVDIPSSVGTIAGYAFSGCSSLTSVNIPSNVSTIGEYAFNGCRSLTSVDIPSSMSTIAVSAFSYCTNLTSVDIPSNVTTIGMAAFKGCTSLISVDIPGNVDSIGESAFEGCSSLTSVGIPSSVTTIGMSAFEGCRSLTSFIFPSGNPNYAASDDGTMLLSNDRTTLIAYPSASGAVTIPSAVTSIEARAFLGCSSLTSVTFLSGSTNIGAYAFYDCTNLQSLSTNLASIGEHAFSGCSNLTSVTFSSGLTTIGEYAFNSCSSFTSLTIPSNVMRIEKWAFIHCNNLNTVVFEDSAASWSFGGESIKISVNNSTTNATYLRTTYYNKDWSKKL